MNRSPSPGEIVACVRAAWQDGASDEGAVEQLVALGLRREEGTDAVELVRCGMMRGALLSAGLPANQISSDVDDNAIFLAAIAAGRVELEKAANEQPIESATLQANLASDDVEVRRTAVYELGQSKEPDVVPRLVKALGDPDLYVRNYAIQALATLKAEEAVGPCCSLLESDPQRLILVNAIKALAEIRDPAAVPALINATRHDHPFVRHDAAWALGEFADASAVPALEALLQDTTIPVEKNHLGLTTHTSSYSVSDQARRSLEKIRKTGAAPPPRSAGAELALSFAWTTVGIVILVLAVLGYLGNKILSTIGLGIGSLILTIGLLGLFWPAKKPGTESTH